MEILKNSEIVINDNLLKSEIGKRVLAYRKYYINCTREQFTKILDCGDTTLINVERGKTFPDLKFISELSDYSTKSVNFFIKGRNFGAHIEDDDRKILESVNDKEKIIILMKSLCEKHDILHMYDKNIINMIFDERERFNTKIIGYLINFEREKRNVSRKQLADAIDFLEKSLSNLEYGNSTVSFKALYKISEYLEVPMDFFLMGYLKDKRNVIEYLITNLFFSTDASDKRFLRNFMKEYKIWRISSVKR